MIDSKQVKVFNIAMLPNEY